MTNRGTTVLYGACFGGVIATIHYLIRLWPAAALVIATYYVWRERMLPYDCAVDRHIAQEVIDCIAQASKDTACALIEYSLCARTSMAATLTDRVSNGVALTQTLSPHLTPASQSRRQRRLAATVENDKGLQCIFCGLVRMNKADRNYVHADSSNAVIGLAVLNSVSNIVVAGERVATERSLLLLMKVEVTSERLPMNRRNSEEPCFR
jgi:hypothetical protein